MYKRALISVSNKTGLEVFLKPLTEQGLELVSTGGTGQFLRSKGFTVTDVRELTDFAEVLSGRVKTLHPYIHIALLSRDWILEDQEVLKKYQLRPFDLVIGNLYPFEEKRNSQLDDKELVEWIDIGGPSFLRAAAKNYFRITTLCHPEDYSMAQKGTNLEQRKNLAAKVFEMLSKYDSMIAERLKCTNYKKSESLDFSSKASFFKKLRYGENPHQKADWYKKDEGLHDADILHGKVLSYNNLLDFSSAVLAVREFSSFCSAVAIKHNNPCGAAIADNIDSAVQKALKGDPLSVFGGLLALNRPMDRLAAEHLDSVFLEGVIAPDFSSQALEHLKRKKNLRVLKWPDMLSSPLPINVISEIVGGVLVQTRDQIQKINPGDWEIIGREPAKEIIKDLIFAVQICAHLKSNAIAIVKKGQTLGLGMGQVNRVDAVKLALHRVETFHPLQKKDLILASDAFFPFSDSIELAAQGGVSWIIQPGGSIRDEEIFEKVKECGINMVLTGERHFKH